MKRGQDISITLPGFYLVHHNLPGKEVERHHHVEHLLFIPLQGEIGLKTDAVEFRCGVGKMIYVPPKTPHSFDSSQHQGERLIAIISEKMWKNAKGPQSTPCVLMTSQLCKEILFYLLLNQKTKYHESLILVFIQTLAEALETGPTSIHDKMAHWESQVGDERLKAVLEFFQKNLSESISMTKAASHSGLSVRSLNRLFLDELGLSPRQALIQYRIQKAKELLLTGNQSVTSAALEVGYNSLTQFIKAFRQVTGQLPSEIRRFGQKQ